MDTKVLNTRFAGLKLKNPIIISSSGLTERVDKLRILEQNGAATIVLKSIFEEQIMHKIDYEYQKQSVDTPESYDFLSKFITTDHVENYLNLIKEAKKECSIPIIASINCYTMRAWTDFAKHIEQAGADAIELNIMQVDTSKDYVFGRIEQLHVDILAAVKKAVKIPVIMKLGRQFTNIVALINQLEHNNADGVVMFNRSYVPDINTSNMSFKAGPVFSDEQSFPETMRWCGITSGEIPKIDIAASSGIYSGDDIIKGILTGASAIEICSVIYTEGPDFIPVMLNTVID